MVLLKSKIKWYSQLSHIKLNFKSNTSCLCSSFSYINLSDDKEKLDTASVPAAAYNPALLMLYSKHRLHWNKYKEMPAGMQQRIQNRNATSAISRGGLVGIQIAVGSFTYFCLNVMLLTISKYFPTPHH